MSTSPPFQFYIFLLVFNGVLWALHFWVYRKLIRALSPSTRFATPRATRIIAVVFVLFDLPWIFLYVYRKVHWATPNALGWTIMFPFAVWQGVLFFWVGVLIIQTIVSSITKLFSWIAKKIFPPKKSVAPVEVNASRRKFLHGGALGLTGYAFAASTAGVLFRDDYETNTRVITIPGLPEEFKGFRIALISDIHSGIFLDKETMQHYAAVVNALNADCIVLPGDYVNSLDSEIYPFAEAFSALHAPYGVFGVTGNHDHFANAEVVCREAEQAGIKMLRNRHVLLERNGARIALLGIDDPPIGRKEPTRFLQTGKSEPIESMLRALPAGTKNILLCHRPYPFEEFSQMGMDLMLSGHTHGGQIVLAEIAGVSLSFAKLASKYVSGLYRSESTPSAQMYVSRGIGTVGLPLRLNCPPEITTIVLS